MLTQDNLEKAARKYCELAGVDPDEAVAHGADPDSHGFVLTICLYSPRWQRVAREIQRSAMILESIAHIPGGLTSIGVTHD